jgi:hypothetical protein
VLARDREFSARVAHGGTLKAYRNFTTWDKETRLYRDAMFPIIGQRNLQAFLKSHAEGNEWEPISGAVAASGELGYTYGKWTQPADRSQTGYYLRVWRFLSGRWLVVAEVMKHLPRQ